MEVAPLLSPMRSLSLAGGERLSAVLRSDYLDDRGRVRGMHVHPSSKCATEIALLRADGPQRLETAQIAPALLRLLPRPLRALLGALILKFENLIASGADALGAMLPGIRYDFNVVGGIDSRSGTFRALDMRGLLLAGTESQAFLREAITRLQKLLPDARRLDLPGLTHSGPWNAKRGGRHDLVARVIIEFFAA